MDDDVVARLADRGLQVCEQLGTESELFGRTREHRADQGDGFRSALQARATRSHRAKRSLQIELPSADQAANPLRGTLGSVLELKAVERPAQLENALDLPRAGPEHQQLIVFVGLLAGEQQRPQPGAVHERDSPRSMTSCRSPERSTLAVACSSNGAEAMSSSPASESTVRSGPSSLAICSRTGLAASCGGGSAIARGYHGVSCSATPVDALAARNACHSLPMTVVELPGHDVAGLRAANPGPFTLTGTNSWVVGRDPAWLIDPGPSLADHLRALRTEIESRGGLGGILLTHDHADHAEAVAAAARHCFRTRLSPPRAGTSTGGWPGGDELGRTRR